MIRHVLTSLAVLLIWPAVARSQHGADLDEEAKQHESKLLEPGLLEPGLDEKAPGQEQAAADHPDPKLLKQVEKRRDHMQGVLNKVGNRIAEFEKLAPRMDKVSARFVKALEKFFETHGPALGAWQEAKASGSKAQQEQRAKVVLKACNDFLKATKGVEKALEKLERDFDKLEVEYKKQQAEDQGEEGG